MIDSIQPNDLTWSNYSDLAQVLISIIAIIFSYFTFKLAMRVHKEFSMNHAKSKQVEKMSELTEFLNNTKIRLLFTDFYEEGNAGARSYGIYYNIFEIGNLLNNQTKHSLNHRTIDFSDYDDCPVCLDLNSSQIMDIKPYIDSAFIPKKIADALSNFFVKSSVELDSKSLNNVNIVILNSTKEHKILFKIKQPNCESLKSWLSFKTYSRDLTKLISNWFISNGIKDFNLRIDYKTLGE